MLRPYLPHPPCSVKNQMRGNVLTCWVPHSAYVRAQQEHALRMYPPYARLGRVANPLPRVMEIVRAEPVCAARDRSDRNYSVAVISFAYRICWLESCKLHEVHRLSMAQGSTKEERNTRKTE